MARRRNDTREAAEAAFKKATTKVADPFPNAQSPRTQFPKSQSIPGVKETVSLRIDRDVLDFFQEDGPGWQDRINAALRKAAGK
ncbi:MAG: BrnA antitoxin family protein [Xanthobacteraceae bacterium]|nr:BrnA antitoxin family protein [Xanthobacteraceae bacterium]